MRTNTSIIKNGNSLMVVIPSNLIRQLGIKQRDKAQVQVDPVKGQVIYTFINNRQLPLV